MYWYQVSSHRAVAMQGIVKSVLKWTLVKSHACPCYPFILPSHFIPIRSSPTISEIPKWLNGYYISHNVFSHGNTILLHVEWAPDANQYISIITCTYKHNHCIDQLHKWIDVLIMIAYILNYIPFVIMLLSCAISRRSGKILIDCEKAFELHQRWGNR